MRSQCCGRDPIRFRYVMARLLSLKEWTCCFSLFTSECWSSWQTPTAQNAIRRVGTQANIWLTELPSTTVWVCEHELILLARHPTNREQRLFRLLSTIFFWKHQDCAIGMLTVWHWTQICKSVPSNNTSKVFLHEHRREPVGHKWPLGSCLKPLILLCAGFCNCPRQQTTMAAKLSKAWHSDRRCFTRSCTPETRSLQFEVCKLGRSDNQCTVRLSKALSQKASSSLEAPLH